MIDYALHVAGQVALTIQNNWVYLALGIFVAAAVTTYVGTDRLAAWLHMRTAVAIPSAVAVSVVTPLCSCGTTAVVLSMMASRAPWAPIVAFMVASPLSSPSELFVSAGLFGWPFASLFFVGSIVLGLVAGVVTYVVEQRRWLEGQARFRDIAGGGGAPQVAGLGPGAAHVSEFRPPSRVRTRALAHEIWLQTRRIVPLFVAFAAIGYAITGLVPQAWIQDNLGTHSPFGVVLAATLGIPFYLNTDSSLPLVSSLVHGGMGPGSAIAFLITGAGTSVGALAGALVIARWRVLAIVVVVLWIGAIVLGLIADQTLAGTIY